MLSKPFGALAAALILSLSTSSFAARPVVGMRHTRIASTRVSAPSDRGDVGLTLDPALQKEVASLLQASHAVEAGAVVIDVRTGRILAWASVDPAGRDMVSQPYAPPASIFKIVAATALIDRAHVPVQARQCFVGGERSARLSDLRPNGAGAGVRCETLETALGYSRNLVVAGLSRRHLDAEALNTTARLLGIGGDIPIDIHVDKGSVEVPSDEAGMARAAAGFGPGRMSPLEAAYMMATIARGGSRPTLHILEQSAAESADSGQAMRPSTARTLTRMLELTVREGTCAKAFRDERGSPYFPRMRIAAKTGTLAKANPTRLYSWFTSFAPSDHPEVAVAVMLANETRWWQKGNQVGRDILRAYFAQKKRRRVR
ncbi:MAG: penicillin-binding protein [Deltaproteobacteria bacterium]|nr:penicillin-binding protein [Deltaproteobacteria bacterium]